MVEVGIYSAALRLSAIGSIVVSSILTVMKPKASKLSNYPDIRSYMMDSAIFTLLIAALFILDFARVSWIG